MVAALGLRDHGRAVLSSQASASGGRDEFKDTVLGVLPWFKLILFGYLAIIDNLDLAEEDSLQTCAEFYEELLQRFSKEDITLGEFIVPQAISRLVVQILNPKTGETIYDPSCGSGSFLTEAYKYLRTQEGYSQLTGGMAGHMLIGLEKKPVAAMIASMNMALHGLWGDVIRRRNALETDGADMPQHFDVVLTNPPFGLSTHVTDQYGIRGARKPGEVLFVDHIMGRLSPGGRCGIIVPDGLLYRQGDFREVRKKLIEHFNISLVVSLPSGSFPHASVKTSIVFFNSPGPTTEVLYYEIGRPGGMKAATKKYEINQGDVAEVYEVWKRWRAYLRKEASKPILSEHSRTVNIDKLRKRNYDLSPRPVNHIDRSDDNTSTSDLLAELAANSRELSAAVGRLCRAVNSNEEL